MKRYGHRAAAVVSLMCTVYAAVPAASAHDGNKKIDATLYEVTENMSLDDLSMPTLRTATAALQGTAKLGSPLCPADLVDLLVGLGLLTRADKPCSVTAVGNDAIETATGSGSVDGTFAVVINLDNTTDAPEFVAMTGTFKGSMQVVIDTTAKPPRTLPLINLNDGTFTPTDVLGFPITCPRSRCQTLHGYQRARPRSGQVRRGAVHRRVPSALHGGQARLASPGVLEPGRVLPRRPWSADQGPARRAVPGFPDGPRRDRFLGSPQ